MPLSAIASSHGRCQVNALENPQKAHRFESWSSPEICICPPVQVIKAANDEGSAAGLSILADALAMAYFYTQIYSISTVFHIIGKYYETQNIVNYVNMPVQSRT